MATATTTTTPPVAGCTPLFTGDALRRADRRASERHRLPSIVLMDRASVAAAAAIDARYDLRAALVLCGTGNNGGDGYGVARHLADAGWDVEVAVPRGGAPRTPDAMTMATVARTLGLRARPFAPAMLEPRRVVVDALLGTGGRGAPRGPVGAALSALTRCGHPIVALDVPSGVDADTGAVAGPAVRAELTITFHGDMPGLHVAPGRDHAGDVIVVDIGIPRAVTATPTAWLTGDDVPGAPPKDGGTDKYGAGAVLVVAGSPGLTGAGILCARATLRAGAGLTVAAVPAAVQPVYATAMTEVMSAPIPDDEGHLAAASVAPVVAQAARVGAVALGPGLGRAEVTTPFVHEVAAQLPLPMVIDADGLWHLDRRLAIVAARAAPTVLTPHAGEAARLLGVTRADVEAGRLAAAREIAVASRAVTVLKGPGTVVCDPHGTTVVDGIGTSALASAGTGDVLTGIVAALLARGIGALEAAVLAVVAHGRAGRAAGRGDGTIAGDLIEALPAVLGSHA